MKASRMQEAHDVSAAAGARAILLGFQRSATNHNCRPFLTNFKVDNVKTHRYDLNRNKFDLVSLPN